MAAYDAHPRTVSWFEAALIAPNAEVRLRAVRLLEEVDIPSRRVWLTRMQGDPDTRVRVVAEAIARRASSDAGAIDLFESDFAVAVMAQAPPEMQWEWEYDFFVCEGLYVPRKSTKVWIGREDDELARSLALMKAGVGRTRPDRVAIMVDKRLVNLYTRSPKSLAEAAVWARQGRPAFTERD